MFNIDYFMEIGDKNLTKFKRSFLQPYFTFYQTFTCFTIHFVEIGDKK